MMIIHTLLFAPDCVCMLLFAAFFPRGPHSSSPNHIPQRWLETLSEAYFQLFLSNATPHICTFRILRHGKHLVRLENLVAWFISAPGNGNNSRRFPSRVSQSSGIEMVRAGPSSGGILSQLPVQLTVASRSAVLTFLSLCRKLLLQ